MENHLWGKLTRFSMCSNGTEWDRPELYLLTSNWVNKIALYEYIEAIN